MMENSKFKNWKSTLGFFLFLGLFGYTVIKDTPNPEVVSITAWVAGVSFIVMVIRSENTVEIVKKIADAIASKFGKKHV